MNTNNIELTNSLITSIDKLTATVTSTESFIVEQAPVLVQQLIAWGITSSVLGLIVSIAAFLFSTNRIIKCWHYDENGEMPTFLAIWLASLLWVILSSNSLIKVIIAPSVFVLEYAKGLVG